MRGGRGLAVALGVVAALGGPSRAGEAPPEPIERGIGTTVEVKLVTLDVVVVDRDGRTIPDLAREEFEVQVEGRPPAVADTLDVTCPGGAIDDPRGVENLGWEQSPDLEIGIRRVVLAFDYLHLATMRCPDMTGSQPCHYPTKAIGSMIDVLERKPAADEEIMVVVLDGGLRIEQPFTRDRARVIEALRRMDHDVTLWAGRFDHLTERPLFAGLEALLTVLRVVPGPKGVVLLSAGEGPGRVYEGEFRRVATLASDAEASLYPVDLMGVFSKRPT